MPIIDMYKDGSVWRAGRQSRGMAGFGALDVQATVSQMDAAVAQLRSAWDSLNSKFSVQWTQGLVDAENARFNSLKGLIDDLDVGGVARQHVFFPLEGQTQDEAWQTWQDTAEYVRQGLNDLGTTIGNWSFTNVTQQIGSQVGDNLKGLGTVVLVVLGGVVVLQIIQLGRRSYAGLPPKRRRKSRRLRRRS